MSLPPQKSLLDLNGVTLMTLADKLLANFDYPRPKIIEASVHLIRQSVAADSPLFCLIPFGRVYVALNVNLAFQPGCRDPCQNGRKAIFAYPALTQQEQNSECLPFHNF